jgi:hypothetical protein
MAVMEVGYRVPCGILLDLSARLGRIRFIFHVPPKIFAKNCRKSKVKNEIGAYIINVG